MEGLLKKAIQLRERVIRARKHFEGEHLASNDADGISAEDQADVMNQIEEAVSQSKTKITPELFSFKAKNRGFLLPLLVNLAAVVLVGGGIFVFSQVFAVREASNNSSDVSLHSAEGLVLDEVRKQAEANLAAKNQEIQDINDRLGKIASERNALATDMDAKVRSRENELKAELARQLETERARLKGQGISEAEITRRLQDFEKQKNDTFNAQLAAFRKQADDDRKKSEAALQSLETEYTQSLTKANQDKERLNTESKQREDELRKQLAAQQSASQNELSDAAQQIKRLSDQREQERTLSTQISSYYGSVRDYIRKKNWDQADATLNLLRDFLNSGQVTAVDSLRQRRDAELFVVDSLHTLIDRERRGAETDSIVQSAVVLNEIQGLYQQGLAAQNAGKAQDAERFYTQALQRLPSIAASYGFLQQQVSARQNEALANALKDEKTRQDLAVSDAVKAAVLNVQNQAQTAAEKLRASLESDYQQRLDTANTELSSLKSQQKDLETARTALQAKLTEAEKAVAILRAGSAGGSGSAGTTGGSGSINGGTAGTGTASGASGANGTSGTAGGTGATTDAQLLSRLNTQEASLKQLNLDKQNLDSKIAELNKNIEAKDADAKQLREQVSRLQTPAKSYETITKAYQDYKTAETALGPSDALKAKVLLDNFLGSEAIRGAFPGLLDKIKNFDRAYEASGGSTVTLKLADFVYTVSSFDTAEERRAFITKELKRPIDDTSREMYESLLKIVEAK